MFSKYSTRISNLIYIKIFQTPNSLITSETKLGIAFPEDDKTSDLIELFLVSI